MLVWHSTSANTYRKVAIPIEDVSLQETASTRTGTSIIEYHSKITEAANMFV